MSNFIFNGFNILKKTCLFIMKFCTMMTTPNYNHGSYIIAAGSVVIPSHTLHFISTQFQSKGVGYQSSRSLKSNIYLGLIDFREPRNVPLKFAWINVQLPLPAVFPGGITSPGDWENSLLTAGLQEVKGEQLMLMSWPGSASSHARFQIFYVKWN